MLRTLATVAASGAMVTALALPAAASAPYRPEMKPTEITGFTASANPVAYQQPITFTGELVTWDNAPVPVPGEKVQVQIGSPGLGTVILGTGQTGPDGRFSITATVPSGGLVTAVFSGDAAFDASHSPDPLLLQAKHLPSRIVLDKVPASVAAGTAVTFSGTVQVQVNGVWQGFAGAPLTLTMEPYTSSLPNVSWPTTSGSGGRFSLTETVSETSEWRVDNVYNGYVYGDWFTDGPSVAYGWMNGVSKTRIVGFGLPSHDEAHHAYYQGMYATGQVQRWNGTSWVPLIYGWVDLYYRPKGSTTWHRDVSAQAGQDGDFRTIVSVHLGTADWQVRVRPAADTQTSTSPNTITNTITDHTHIASVDIYRGGSGSAISGQVTDWYNGQGSFSTLRGLKIHLYYRARGSKTWHDYRTVTVGRDGVFQFNVPKGRGYSFKVVLPAQSSFESCTSRTL